MALKVKITKEEFDALPEVLKAEYKGDGAGYVLDTDFVPEDVAPLRNALERVREENRLMREAEDKKVREAEQRIRDELRASGNTEELERRFTAERETLRTELSSRVGVREQQLTRLLVDERAQSMAVKLAGVNAPILLPHIKMRLRAEFDGDDAVCKVVSADGQPSTLTVADLEKEFLNNKLFASILIGVDSSGGGAARNQGGGASKKPNEYTTEERNDLYRNNRAEFDRLFPQQ